MNEAQITLQNFQMVTVIGRGSYAKVVLAKKKNEEKKFYALKILKKKYIEKRKQTGHVMIERNILTKLDHPFIVKMHHSFQDSAKLYFVLEFCPGGQLFNLMQKKPRLSQQQAKFFAAQIVLALQYLHSFNIVYRDMKPENILIDRYGYIKLTDFGLSNFVQNTSTSIEVCGTPQYLSPEMILKKGHGKPVDWWGLGVIICEMVNGTPPFYCKNPKQMFRRIRYEDPEYPPSSVYLRKLLEGLFRKNPQERLGSTKGAEEIKSHPWFENIEWEALSKFSVKPPFIPGLEKEDDVSNFLPEFTESSINSGASSPFKEHNQIFNGFAYNNTPIGNEMEGETNLEFHIKLQLNEQQF